VPHADVSDYPLRRVTRQPVRDRGRYEGLTADDVQLRPRLMDEDEEQKAARRVHRLPDAAFRDDEEDEAPRARLNKPIATMAIGLLMMFGAGVWFRLYLASGIVVMQAPLLFVAGMALTLAGLLGYFRRSGRLRKRRTDSYLPGP
jgi:hypothetical protein